MTHVSSEAALEIIGNKEYGEKRLGSRFLSTKV
jgi:hypothetical protein